MVMRIDDVFEHQQIQYTHAMTILPTILPRHLESLLFISRDNGHTMIILPTGLPRFNSKNT